MKFMYNELYNATNVKHAGGKWETMNQLGVALRVKQQHFVLSSAQPNRFFTTSKSCKGV